MKRRFVMSEEFLGLKEILKRIVRGKKVEVEIQVNSKSYVRGDLAYREKIILGSKDKNGSGKFFKKKEGLFFYTTREDIEESLLKLNLDYSTRFNFGLLSVEIPIENLIECIKKEANIKEDNIWFIFTERFDEKVEYFVNYFELINQINKIKEEEENFVRRNINSFSRIVRSMGIVAWGIIVIFFVVFLIVVKSLNNDVQSVYIVPSPDNLLVESSSIERPKNNIVVPKKVYPSSELNLQSSSEITSESEIVSKPELSNSEIAVPKVKPEEIVRPKIIKPKEKEPKIEILRKSENSTVGVRSRRDFRIEKPEFKPTEASKN